MPLRTLNSIKQDHAAHLAAGGRKGTAKNFGNIHLSPLLELEPHLIAPIPLHIGLGVWVKLYDLYLDEIRQQLEKESDEKRKQRRDAVEARKELDEKKAEVETITAKVKELKNSVKELKKCGHGFHTKCIDKWLKTEKRCPVCNADVI